VYENCKGDNGLLKPVCIVLSACADRNAASSRAILRATRRRKSALFSITTKSGGGTAGTARVAANRGGRGVVSPVDRMVPSSLAV
jgi:hypothetical protein